ncbi:MAG: metal-dependent hydrolase [Leptolyngbya sp. SIO1D8]|nr:metal-dependent hydrolase [Leptolyngbya sp. SIO1D8]
MASPIGHTLAGYLGYILMPVLPTKSMSPRWRMLGAISLANLPDLDFLPGLLVGNVRAFHRQASHSLTLALVTGGIFALSIWWRSRAVRKQPQLLQIYWLPWGLWATAVYLGHLGLDLLMVDRIFPFGLQLLWPFSQTFFVSPIVLIPGLNFEQLLSGRNFCVVIVEILLVTPLIVLAGRLKHGIKINR